MNCSFRRVVDEGEGTTKKLLLKRDLDFDVWKCFSSFYLRVSAVLATATWLGGWLAVRYCIKMTKRILKFFGPSGSHDPLRRYQIPRGTPSAGASNTRGWENWRFSCDFRRISPFISETVRDRPMVTMER